MPFPIFFSVSTTPAPSAQTLTAPPMKKNVMYKAIQKIFLFSSLH